MAEEQVGTAQSAEQQPFVEDPWARSKTRNGLPGDEVISALQKSIRRGDERKACEFAYEMYITSPAWEEKLWRRLLAISVEAGVGFEGALEVVSDTDGVGRAVVDTTAS